MPSKKVSELETLILPAGPDLLYIIDDVAGTPMGKNISLDEFFGQVPSNTNISATLTVSGKTTLTNTSVETLHTREATTESLIVSSNGVIITTPLTPANSSVQAIATGKLFWDENFLYIKVSETEIKRVALSTF